MSTPGHAKRGQAREPCQVSLSSVWRSPHVQYMYSMHLHFSSFSFLSCTVKTSHTFSVSLGLASYLLLFLLSYLLTLYLFIHHLNPASVFLSLSISILPLSWFPKMLRKGPRVTRVTKPGLPKTFNTHYKKHCNLHATLATNSFHKWKLLHPL